MVGAVAQPLNVVARDVGTGELGLFVIARLRPGRAALASSARASGPGCSVKRIDGFLGEPDEVDLVEPHALPFHHDLAAALETGSARRRRIRPIPRETSGLGKQGCVPEKSCSRGMSRAGRPDAIEVDFQVLMLVVEQPGLLAGGVGEPDPLNDAGTGRLRQDGVAILDADFE